MIDYTLRTSLKDEIPIVIIYQDGIRVNQKEILVKNINENKISAYCYDKGLIYNFERNDILSAMVLELSEELFTPYKERESNNYPNIN